MTEINFYNDNIKWGVCLIATAEYWLYFAILNTHNFSSNILILDVCKRWTEDSSRCVGNSLFWLLQIKGCRAALFILKTMRNFSNHFTLSIRYYSGIILLKNTDYFISVGVEYLL